MSAILANELVVRRSVNQSDAGSNGGGMSQYAVPSGVVGSLFPNADETERTTGSTKYRKIWWHIDHNGTEGFLSARIYQDTNSTAADKWTFFPAAATDTQSSITGSEVQYGCGALDANVLSNALSVTVRVEPGVTGLFQVGQTIRITDRATPDGAGNVEFHQVATRSQAGDVVTIGLATPLAYSYLASNSRVSSVYDVGDIRATAVLNSVSSVAGTFDEADITLTGKGTVAQVVTLTFTSATAYDVTSASLGVLGSGTVAAGCAPTNPGFGVPYFSIAPTAFGGTFAPGDTIVFTTAPQAVSVWVKKVVPAGASTGAASMVRFVLEGGSE